MIKNRNKLYDTFVDELPLEPMTNKCIVLDLDQTLIATQDDMNSCYDLNIVSDPELVDLRTRSYYFVIEDLEKPGIGTNYEFWGVARPHVHEFLLFCFSYFKIVAVWSAGSRLYVEGLIDYLFRDLPYPDVVFTADDTIFHPGKVVEKPLSKMIEIMEEMNEMNTYAIDDNVTTFSKNKNNGILIPAYEPGIIGYRKNNKGREVEFITPTVSTLQEDETALLKLKYWLLQPEIIYADDVRKLNKSKIFETPVSKYKEIVQDTENKYLKRSPPRKSPPRRNPRTATINSPDKSIPSEKRQKTKAPKIDVNILHL